MNIKVKFIAIAVLALLLCAAVPMAATAVKPETSPKPIVAPIYIIVPHETGLGPVVGHVVIQDNGKYTITLTGIDPSVPRVWRVEPATPVVLDNIFTIYEPHPEYNIAQVYINEGSTPFVAKGQISTAIVSNIRTALSNGDIIVVYHE